MTRYLIDKTKEQVDLLSTVTSVKETILIAEIDRMKSELTDKDKRLQKSDSQMKLLTAKYHNLLKTLRYIIIYFSNSLYR